MVNLINLIKKIFNKQESILEENDSQEKITVPESKSSTDSYLLEYRYSGYPRKYILDRYFELKRAYRITHPKYHYVPHITIAGPINTSNERKLIQQIKEIIFKNAHHFHEPGNLVETRKYITFETNVGSHVLAIEIKPPKSLVNLKNEIETQLNADASFQCQVYKKVIWHTTLWNMKKNNAYENKDKFRQVWRNLDNSLQEMKFILDRITLIKNGLILKEFDLVDLNILSRTKSLNNDLRYKSYLKIRDELESKGESFKFSNTNLQPNLGNDGNSYDDEDFEEYPTEQDGTIQAEWDY